MRTKFKNANEAYDYFLDKILLDGVDFDNTKALFNVGFTMDKPEENLIFNKERRWNLKYAMAEWEWYLSGDPSIDKLGEIYGKIPPIWEKMADSDRKVRSNYGWQWQRNNQIDLVTAKLRQNPNTRHAAISILSKK
jgi:thymidylate synthase